MTESHNLSVGIVTVHGSAPSCIVYFFSRILTSFLSHSPFVFARLLALVWRTTVNEIFTLFSHFIIIIINVIFCHLLFFLLPPVVSFRFFLLFRLVSYGALCHTRIHTHTRIVKMRVRKRVTSGNNNKCNHNSRCTWLHEIWFCYAINTKPGCLQTDPVQTWDSPKLQILSFSHKSYVCWLIDNAPHPKMEFCFYGQIRVNTKLYLLAEFECNIFSLAKQETRVTKESAIPFKR